MSAERDRAVAEAVHRACVEALEQAWQSAGVSGLCGEGRWEVALQALRSLELERLLPGREG